MNLRKFLPFGLLAATLLGVIALAFPIGTVAAQTTNPPTPKDPQAQALRANAGLEKAFQAVKVNADRQALNLDRLDGLTLKISNLIDRAKANGKDVSALVAGLAAFKSKEAEARAQHQAAVDLIKAHKGFDDNGKVVDREQAKDTISKIREKLQSVRQTIIEAVKSFRDVIKSWRSANPPKPST